MIKKFLAALAAIGAVAVGMVAVAPAPAANAITCIPFTDRCEGGKITHGTDDGYDQPIYILCNYNQGFAGPNETQPRSFAYMNQYAKLVYEGENSNSKCGDDTDIIVVRDNEEVWCWQPQPGLEPSRYEKTFDATGPHKINDFWEERCVLHRD